MTVTRIPLSASVAELEAFIAPVRAAAPPGSYLEVNAHYGEPYDCLTVEVMVPVGTPQPKANHLFLEKGMVKRPVPCSLEEFEQYLAEIRRYAGDWYVMGKVHCMVDHTTLLCRLSYPDELPPTSRARTRTARPGGDAEPPPPFSPMFLLVGEGRGAAMAQGFLLGCAASGVIYLGTWLGWW